MMRLFLLSAYSVFFLSCNNQASVPSGVLSAEKMEAVLWDVLRADLFVTNYVVARDTTADGHSKGPQLYASILKKHGVTDSVFRSSLEYYRKHPKQFYPILDSIAQRPSTAPTPLAAVPSPGADSNGIPKQPVKGATDSSLLKPMAY